MKYITLGIITIIGITGVGFVHAEYERAESDGLRLTTETQTRVAIPDVQATGSAAVNRESGRDEDESENDESEHKDSENETEDSDDDYKSATGTSMSFHADDLEDLNVTARQDLITKAAALGNITTDADLKLMTQAAMAQDPNIIKIDITDTEITMDYRQPAKLFGFIPVKLLVTSSIDSNGKVTFNYPWLAKLSQTNKVAMDTAVQKQDSLSDVNEKNQLKLQLTVDKKAKLEEMLSNLMKKVSETSDTITQNLK